jgi:hypothetical protein
MYVLGRRRTHHSPLPPVPHPPPALTQSRFVIRKGGKVETISIVCPIHPAARRKGRGSGFSIYLLDAGPLIRRHYELSHQLHLGRETANRTGKRGRCAHVNETSTERTPRGFIQSS